MGTLSVTLFFSICIGIINFDVMFIVLSYALLSTKSKDTFPKIFHSLIKSISISSEETVKKIFSAVPCSKFLTDIVDIVHNACIESYNSISDCMSESNVYIRKENWLAIAFYLIYFLKSVFTAYFLLSV